MMEKGLLGIDIGGTRIKAVVCSRAGELLAMAQAPTLPAYRCSRKIDTGPQRRLNGEMLWRITVSVIRDALGRLPGDCSLVSAAVSSVGCTVLAFDDRDCQLPIYGDDGDMNREYYRLQAAYGKKEFEHLTGYPMEKSLTGLHLGACCTRGMKTGKVFSVDDYIVYRLTGIASRNYSTAASCGMWNAQEGRWLDFLKEGTGLSDRVLGKPEDSGVFVGRVCRKACEETGLSGDVKVATGGMDYQCAAFALHSLIRDRLFHITGTIDLLAYYGKCKGRDGEWPRLIRDHHVIPGTRSLMMEAVGAAQAEWLKNGIMAPKQDGSSLDWSCFSYGFGENYKSVPAHSELFIPQVFGDRVLSMDKQATGMLGGLNSRTDSLTLLRTVLEGIAYQTKQMAGYLTPHGEHKEVLMVGGGSFDRAWVQLKADVMGNHILLPAIREASAVGAALLGGVGAGFYRSYEEAGEVTKEIPCDLVLCDPARSRYYHDMFHEIYLPAVKQWSEMNERLAAVNERHGMAQEFT